MQEKAKHCGLLFEEVLAYFHEILLSTKIIISQGKMKINLLLGNL